MREGAGREEGIPFDHSTGWYWPKELMDVAGASKKHLFLLAKRAPALWRCFQQGPLLKFHVGASLKQIADANSPGRFWHTYVMKMETSRNKSKSPADCNRGRMKRRQGKRVKMLYRRQFNPIWNKFNIWSGWSEVVLVLKKVTVGMIFQETQGITFIHNPVEISVLSISLCE